MAVAKEEEKKVLEKYEAMNQEYEKLSQSEALFQLFDYEDDSVDLFAEE